MRASFLCAGVLKLSVSLNQKQLAMDLANIALLEMTKGPLLQEYNPGDGLYRAVPSPSLHKKQLVMDCDSIALLEMFLVKDLPSIHQYSH
jgi:hypothetical protein